MAFAVLMNECRVSTSLPTSPLLCDILCDRKRKYAETLFQARKSGGHRKLTWYIRGYPLRSKSAEISITLLNTSITMLKGQFSTLHYHRGLWNQCCRFYVSAVWDQLTYLISQICWIFIVALVSKAHGGRYKYEYIITNNNKNYQASVFATQPQHML